MAQPTRIWICGDMHADGVSRLQETGYQVTFVKREDFPDTLGQIEILILSPNTQLSRAEIERAPRLRLIGQQGILWDNIDIETATRRGIPVIYTPYAPTEAVAELTIALMLALARNLNSIIRSACAVRLPQQIPGLELRGRTLGLIGVGRVGKRVAELALVLGMHVLGYDPYADWAEMAIGGIEEVPNLHDLLPQVDFLSLHAPLTPETYRIIGTQELTQLPQGAYLINTARRELVDEQALLKALHSGHLAGAALDGPIHGTDDPLWGLDRVILTPTLGSATYAAYQRMGVQIAEYTLAALQGNWNIPIANPQAIPSSTKEQP